MILPFYNQQLAKKYFDTLSPRDISVRYYNGLKYEPPANFLQRLKSKFTFSQKLDTLKRFYPYQKTVMATINEQKAMVKSYIKNSLIFTAVAWTTLFQLARRGYVTPVLKEYGTYLQTHRLFRQYLYGLVLPAGYYYYSYLNFWATHVEHLWITHANRMNSKVLQDPEQTFYPDQKPMRTVTLQPIFQDIDVKAKLYRETEEDEAE